MKMTIEFDPLHDNLEEALQPLFSLYRNTAPAGKPEPKPEELPGQMTFEDPAPAENEPAPPWEPEAPKAKGPTLTDIRALATALSKKDKPALKQIFADFGAAKLSDIPEDRYADLMEKLVAANA